MAYRVFERFRSVVLNPRRRVLLYFVLVFVLVYCMYEDVILGMYENDLIDPFVEMKSHSSSTGFTKTESKPPSSRGVTGIDKTVNNHVCVVIRFFEDQLNSPDYNLQRLLKSIAKQSHPDWEVILLATDNNKLDTLQDFSQQESDKIRLIKFTDIIIDKYYPNTSAKFHNKVYRMTDLAVRKCSPETRWLLITNGDNEYDHSFFNYLDPNSDILSYDFYSRWLNKGKQYDLSKFPPCGRLTMELDKEIHMKEPTRYSCFPNKLKKGATDLGANVLNYQKFIKENRRYSSIYSKDGSQDGFMVENLVKDGWVVNNIGTGKDNGKCLYDHNPNYHSCMMLGKDYKWDDSTLQCISNGELLQYNREAYTESTILSSCISKI